MIYLQLEPTEHKPYVELLRIFAYGVYADYKCNRHRTCFISAISLRFFKVPPFCAARVSQLPELTAGQKAKLKQLTIVSLAAKQKVHGRRLPFCSAPFYDHSSSCRHCVVQVLPYGQLMAELDVSTVRDLEDLVIDCFYSDLLTGKLDHRTMALDVQHATSRDIRTSDVPEMSVTLDNWYERCRARLCITPSCVRLFLPRR